MLQILSRHHDLWLAYVISFTVNLDTAQDIVQELYLKMHDYDKDIMIGEKINFYFVYLVLRNMVFDLKKKEKRFYFTEDLPALEDEEYFEIDGENILEKVLRNKKETKFAQANLKKA